MKRSLLFALLVTLVTVSVFADGPETGVVTGKVTDASGGALPGVTVTIEGNRGTQTVITEGDGVYRFALLPPGQYMVKALLEGFQTAEAVAAVTAGSKSVFDLTMRLETAETITVTSEAPMVDKYNVTAGATMEGETAGEISAAVRSFYGAVQVLPGVTNDVESMDLSQSRPTVNGSLWQESNVYVDGVDATYSMRGGGTRVFLPTSALAEVSLEAGGGGAEYGRNVGSHTNLITKSGTNKFHGDFMGVFTNNAWNENYDPQPALGNDARLRNSFADQLGLDPDDPANEATLRDAAANFVVYGPGERDGSSTNIEASIGGPIVRDKAWFFLARGETSTNQLDKLLDGTVLNNSSELFATIAKANFQPGVKHSLAVTYIDAPVDRIFLLPAMGDRYNATFFDLEGDVKSLTWNYSISSKLFLETKLAEQVSDENRRRPFGPDVKALDPRYTPDPALGGFSPNNNDDSYVQRFDNTWHNGWIFALGYGTNEFPRQQFNLALSHFATQNHEIKYGLDLQQVEWQQDVQRPNIHSGYDFQLGSEFGYTNNCLGTASDPNALIPGDDTRCFFVDYNGHGLAKGSADSDGGNFGAYVRDRFTIGDHWTLNLGLRVEQQTLQNDRGRDVIDNTSLSPRLTSVYDIKGDGKQLVTFSGGRFFVQTPQNLVNTNLQEDWTGASNAFDLFLFLPANTLGPGTCGAAEGAVGSYCLSLGAVRPGRLWELHDQGLINVDIDPYHRDEFVLGYEWQFHRNWAFDAKGIYWRVDDLIGSTLQRDQNGDLFLLVGNYDSFAPTLRGLGFVDQFVANGGTAETANAVLDNFQDDHRNYKGLQLQLNRRFRKGWAIFNNVTLSKVEGRTYGGGNGNNDLGAFDNLNDDYGRNLELVLTEDILASFGDPNVFCAAQGLAATCIDDLRQFLGQPLSTINRFGELPVNRSIIFKSYGYKVWNFAKNQSFNLGGLFVWQDGSPWEKTRATANPVSLTNNAQNTTITTFLTPRGAFDNENFLWLNLSGAWSFPLGRRGLSGQLRLEITNVSNEQETVAVSSRTGEPLRNRRSFQQPRKYRLLGAIRF